MFHLTFTPRYACTRGGVNSADQLAVGKADNKKLTPNLMTFEAMRTNGTFKMENKVC